ncbi:MAG: type II and III secretion system protein family protein [Reyranella sp.]|nr:MAG: type II and III secretion system protein family protein [Reyranella sp.]
MSPSLARAFAPSLWRHAGSTLALLASMALVVHPSVAFAQVVVVDPDSAAGKAQAAKAKATGSNTKKSTRKKTATDEVSDDLNRRESERAAQFMQGLSASPQAAAPVAAAVAAATPAVEPAKPVVDNLPPTVASIPPRPPIASAALTPEVQVSRPVMDPPQMPTVTSPATAERSNPIIQAQQTPPQPVPIQPPASGGGGQPSVVTGGGAPGRAFGQSQIVPAQPPTLTLEINKGTALKLPGPAATVFVAAPDIADVQVRSPTMVYVFAKKPGDTVLYAVDAQDRVLLNTIVSVTSPLSRIKGALDTLHPANGVSYDNQGETIVLSGTVRSTAVAEDARRLALQHVNNQAAKVVNNIRVDAPTQVQLRVKVAEVRRDALKRIGINWQNINNFALAGLSAFGISAGVGAAVRTVTNTGGAATGAIALQSGDLNGFIDLLATQNQATVLAEPNLIAMSGETASFLAGGEIPVIVPQSGTGVATVAVSYKSVGVSLAFTPTIIGDRINLKVAPEVSQLSAEGSVSVPLTATSVVTIPAIKTRKANTTIELGSGQSFAIAGLLLATSQQDVQKIPWLGDVPVLGSLFKSDAYQRGETELVIIITPYFVEPSNGKLRTPLTDRVPPTDVDRLVMQRMNHPTPPRRVAVGRETQAVGPTAGFKLD